MRQKQSRAMPRVEWKGNAKHMRRARHAVPLPNHWLVINEMASLHPAKQLRRA
jgi:hypothetical protein